MAKFDRRQAARYLSIPTIFDEDFVPEVGQTFGRYKVANVFQTRNWDMVLVLFEDGSMACVPFERGSQVITGNSTLYLLELTCIPEANVNYWISKYYHLNGNMEKMGRTKIMFSRVKAIWNEKLYQASDSCKNNYVII